MPRGQESNWTTADQITYMRGLLERGQYVALTTEVATIRQRRWDGKGMSIDVSAIESEGRKMLGQVTEIERLVKAYKVHRDVL